ncbi:MAG: hypothetical protein OXD49_22425 [Candidatus Poribacteria bacterium]|nr:hypothetical protein [Candidatus Poribacteria bacterium]
MQNSLDQFYTKEIIAKLCWNHLIETISSLDKSINDLFFLEPSAGKGAFYSLMPEHRRIGMDLEPKCDGVNLQDFLKTVKIEFESHNTVVVGNPPFGKRGNLAVAFFNHSAYLAETVAFIVPVIFRKFMIHKKLDSRMKFISKLELPKESFEFDNGKTYAVNTEFQIWTRLPCVCEDMREYGAPPIRHKDFQMWQYNNTPEALKVFENDFDFAVPAQGWQDYSRKETEANNCEKHKQWILLKAKNAAILSRLLTIDYNDLAHRCATAIPGFRKGDLVKEYSELYE